MGRTVIVALLRNDLRVHDHLSFHLAHSPAHSDVTHVLPLYVYDERHVELSGLPGFSSSSPPAKTRLCQFWRTGVFRARFLSEAVYDLRDNLRKRKSDLMIRFGKPEVIVSSIVKAFQTDGDIVKAVFMQQEFYSEEQAVEKRLEKSLADLNVELTLLDGAPLIDARDLPFPVSQCPDVFTPFRKRVEGLGKLGRNPLTMPEKFKPCPPFPTSYGSDPVPFGAAYDNQSVDELLPDLLAPIKSPYQDRMRFTGSGNSREVQSAFPYKGGETTALERLEWYFLEGNPPPVASYKKTRNGLVGHAYSTKMSPFLCLGMISPRVIMKALDDHEEEHGSSQDTYWVRFELLWRDYFLYTARKFGTHLFKLGGLEEVTDPKQAKYKMQPGWWKEWDKSQGDDQPVVRWMKGTTGVPFIDANMAELRETGFMSNRGRQNVASFLTKDLQVDWRIGAEFFESHLIDYEPSANWGNWAYVSGVGNDPRASRQFNPIKQGNDYDPHGEYIKMWLPQLERVPSNRIQTPWLLTPDEQKKYVTGTYPMSPVIEQPQWKPHYTKKGPGKLHGNPNERIKNPGPASQRGGQNKGGDGPKDKGFSARGRQPISV